MEDLYLLDTNILVHLIRESLIGDHIRSNYSLFLTAPKPLICVVSEGELRSLALQWKWGKRKQDQMEFYFSFFGRAPIEKPDLLRAYATIDAYAESIGRPMGKNDIWIAAAVHVNGARLITTDTDFDHLVPGFLSRDWIDPKAFKPKS